MTGSSHHPRKNSICGRARHGNPLPPRLRSRLEALFGAPLASVRWHEDGQAEQLGAAAFARGEHLHFARGAFDPETPRGLFVLGHEITHVLQQRQGAGRHGPDAVLEDPDREAEANIAGLLVAAGRPVPGRWAHAAPARGRCQAQCIKLQIDSNAGTIDAAVLAASVDIAISTAVQALNAALVPQPGPTPGYHVTNPQHWLRLAGGLSETGIIVPGYGPGNRPSLLPCRIKVGTHTKWMNVTGNGGTERIYFTDEAVTYAGGRDDLSYPEIAFGFQKLARSYPDHAIARDMLLMMMNKPPLRTYAANEFDFLAGMVALMFGLEASRFPSALVSSLLILDLIMYRKRYGRAGTKEFTLEDAFDSGEKFDFKLKYGGKYPCAVHKPGPGNSRNRRLLGEMGLRAGNDPGRTKHVNLLLDLNHRYVVPRRETTLLIHWIEAQSTDHQLANITVAQINELLIRRLSAAFFTAELPGSFPASPRPDTGAHSYNEDRSDRPSEAQLIGTNGKVFWFPRGRFYHTDVYCKIIGDRSPQKAARLKQSYEKKPAAVQALDKRDDDTNWWNGNVALAKSKQKLRCPDCMRP